MPFKVAWYEENEIIQYKYWGIVTLEDVEQANYTAYTLAADVPTRFFAIVDVIDVEKMTFTIEEMMNNKIVRRSTSSPKVRWALYYDDQNPFYRMIGSLLSANGAHRVKFVTSQAEALDFIEQVKQSKP